jgi:hypothetical protein
MILTVRKVDTLRGLPKAKSNAVLPILREARSVMSRVARASFPSGVVVDVSCLTY